MNQDDILDSLSEKLQDAHNYGHYLSALCPFHSDSRPSLMVYPDSYRCLACGAFGKTENLLKKLDNTLLVPQTRPDFRNPWSRWTKNMELRLVLKQSWQLLSQQPSLGLYLTKRGILPEIQRKLGFGYRDDWYTIPIRDKDNKIIGAVARANAYTNSSSSKYVIPHDQSTDILYVPSWKRILQTDYVYLTFGILDSVSLYIIGEPAMSTTGGKHLNPDALDWCRKEIRVIPDLGEEREARLLVNDLGWRGRTIKVKYPDNCKDANDILTKGFDLIGAIT